MVFTSLFATISQLCSTPDSPTDKLRIDQPEHAGPEWITCSHSPALCQAQKPVRNRKCIKLWSTKAARTGSRAVPDSLDSDQQRTHHARGSLAPCLPVLTPNSSNMTDLVARRKQFSSCDECRRLRVRCDALARGAGSGHAGASPVSCSRCTRRNERCTFEVLTHPPHHLVLLRLILTDWLAVDE